MPRLPVLRDLLWLIAPAKIKVLHIYFRGLWVARPETEVESNRVEPVEENMLSQTYQHQSHNKEKDWAWIKNMKSGLKNLNQHNMSAPGLKINTLQPASLGWKFVLAGIKKIHWPAHLVIKEALYQLFCRMHEGFYGNTNVERVTSQIWVYTYVSLSRWGGMCQPHVIGEERPSPPSSHKLPHRLTVKCSAHSVVFYKPKGSSAAGSRCILSPIFIQDSPLCFFLGPYDPSPPSLCSGGAFGGHSNTQNK